MTAEEFDALKWDIAELSALIAEIGDAASFAVQELRAIEVISCAERIHQTLTEPEQFRHRIQGGPVSPTGHP